jgi:hypothetical protein
MKENRKYFTKLFEIINNKEIGEVFYFNCLEIAENSKKWHKQFDMSLTEEHKRNISDNAPNLLQFI